LLVVTAAVVAVFLSAVAANAQCPCSNGICLCAATMPASPAVALPAASDPGPDAIQAVVTALGDLQTADAANVAAKTVVAQDQAALAACQNTLADDSAAQQQCETAEQAAIAAIQQAVANLTPAQRNKLKLTLSTAQRAMFQKAQAGPVVAMAVTASQATTVSTAMTCRVRWIDRGPVRRMLFRRR
jgi:hypothetical protein